MSRTLAATLALFALVLVATVLRTAPPSPRGKDAPPECFSAARAREVASAITSGASRATGSDANARARGVLVGALERAGFTVELQRAFACGRWACGFVVNVVAKREGNEPTAAAVMMIAHYDSVGASPGASDDGAGASAVVEAARALGDGPRTRRSVIVVLTDGEEDGLVGAEAFVRQHALAKTVRATVNVDARGSAGPSAMFETSRDNAWLLALFARHVDRPVSSSLFYEIYSRMPNDTDFSVAKDISHGVNFANIARIEHYHTPLDSLANADLGTLQHHGENVLAMTRALAESLDVDRPPHGNAAWFDVLSLFVVWWPASWTPMLSLLALGLVVVHAIRMRAKGLGVFAGVASLLGAALASALAGTILRAISAIPAPWVAHPWPSLIVLHGASIAGGLYPAILLGQRGASSRELWAGTWVAWGVLGVAVSLLAPGAAFLFVVPALLAAFFGWLAPERGASVAAIAAAVIWMPLAIHIYDALGFTVPPLVSIGTTMLVSTLAPLVIGLHRRAPLFIAVPASIAVAVAAFVPSWSAAHPQRVNVIFTEQDTPSGSRAAAVFVQASWGSALWGSPPATVVRALGPRDHVHPELALPGSLPAPAAPAPPLGLRLPEIDVVTSSVQDGTRHVRARIRSPRGASTLLLAFDEARRPRVTIREEAATLHAGAVTIRAVPPEGVTVDLVVEGIDPLNVTLYDVSPHVPAGSIAAMIAEARDREPAVPSQDGDLTVTSRRASL